MALLLIVDDDRQVAILFARVLKREGYQVEIAFDCESALQTMAASNRQFDGVLLDLCMPGADGLAFLRQLRDAPKHKSTPVAVITGNHMMNERTEAELRQLGAIVRFKPLWPDDFGRIARTLVTASHP